MISYPIYVQTATATPMTNLYWGAVNSITSTAAYTASSSFAQTQYIPFSTPPDEDSLLTFLKASREVRIADYFEGRLTLADGAFLELDGRGGYRIEDADARVLYRANRVREFNRYINASDLLEEFAGDCVGLGLSKAEFMGFPVELLVRWLVLRAAEADGEGAADPRVLLADYSRRSSVAVLLPPPARKVLPRCLCCGRFNHRAKAALGISFWDGAHLSRYMDKRGLSCPPST